MVDQNTNEKSHKQIFPSEPSLEIFSDASLTGWGAVCRELKTNGPWDITDAKRHINELELIAALNGLMCFTKQTRNATVFLHIDNTTAVSYINKLGGTKSRSLCKISFKIVKWCEDRKIELQAFHLPGILNILADKESRKEQEKGDWKLSSCRPKLSTRLRKDGIQQWTF